MEEFERQDFNQLNENLVTAMIGTDDEETKALLDSIADVAEEVHRNFSSYTKENWDEAEGKMHALYSKLLTKDVEDPLVLGEIKVAMDKFLMDVFPREKKKKEVVSKESEDVPINEEAAKRVEEVVAMNKYDQEEFEAISKRIQDDMIDVYGNKIEEEGRSR